MAITPGMQPESGLTMYAGSDFPHLIRFRSSKEGPDHIVQNRPGSDLNGLVRFGPNASGPEAVLYARIIGPGTGRTQLDLPATSSRLSDSVVFFHRRPESLLKTCPDPIGF